MAVELFSAKFVSPKLQQAADAIAFQTTMKRRAGESRDRGLESIEAVVERQTRVLAKRYDEVFLLDRQNHGPGSGRAGAAICCGFTLFHLGTAF